MSRQTTDGWHTVYGMDVFVEDGRIVRGVIIGRDGSRVTAYPYRYDREAGNWVNQAGRVTLNAFRKGYPRIWRMM